MSQNIETSSTLRPSECWLDVTVLFAGLQVPAPIELAPEVSVEQILEANIVANAVKIATEVQLGLPSNPEDPMHPVCGLRYRVRGRRLLGAEESRFNDAQIKGPKLAFTRAVALMRGLELLHGGTFVHELDSVGNRRLYSYQFNSGYLSVHYDAAYFDGAHADEMRRVFAATRDPYLTSEGTSIGVAIDRLGVAAIRSNQVDMNLDLCIAAEIAFLFGLQRRIDNEKIAETIRENARAFFGDGEFFWSRDDVFQIVRDSYKQRSDTVHGRRGTDPQRDAVLTPLNVRLREVLKACLLAYAERRPTKASAKALWPARVKALAQGATLEQIFAGL